MTAWIRYLNQDRVTWSRWWRWPNKIDADDMRAWWSKNFAGATNNGETGKIYEVRTTTPEGERYAWAPN